VWDGRGDEGRKALEISGGREEDDGREAMKNEKNEQVESVVDGRSDMTIPLRSERGSEAYHLSPRAWRKKRRIFGAWVIMHHVACAQRHEIVLW